MEDTCPGTANRRRVLATTFTVIASGCEVHFARHNDTLTESRPLKRFHSKGAPAITPLVYLTRITTILNVDPRMLINLLFHTRRGFQSQLVDCAPASHCGNLLWVKALSNSFATNSRYAKVGGVELVENAREGIPGSNRMEIGNFGCNAG